MNDVREFEHFSLPLFNQYDTFPNFSYKLIMHLVDNNDDIWKLLKYNSPDCWKEQNLTRDEKMNMIYGGVGDQSNYKVFMDEGQNDVFNDSVCILRIFPLEIFPENQVRSDVYIAFQILSHYDINQMSNYQTRVDTILRDLFKVFNGASVNGVGVLSFDRSAFPRCKASVYGNTPFLGKIVTLGFSYSSIDEDLL